MPDKRRSGARSRGESARGRLRLAIHILLAIAVIAGVFLYLVPKFASYSDVWRALTGLTAGQIGVLLFVTALNVFTYWPQMVAAMPGLTLGQAAVNNQASTAIANTLPGGGALGVAVAYRMFREWGFDNATIGLMAMSTGAWNSFVKFTMPIVALGILALEGDVTRSLTVAGLIGLGALIVSLTALILFLWKDTAARALGRVAGHAVNGVRRLFHRSLVKGWDDRAADVRRQVIDLARSRWHWLTVTTVASHVALYLVLLIALRDLGVSSHQVTWAEVLGVFAFARLASALPITPGGAGVIELTYIGGLVLAGGEHAPVVAAVLLFRALTWGLQIPLGPVAYLVYLRRNSWRRATRSGGAARTEERQRQLARAAR